MKNTILLKAKPLLVKYAIEVFAYNLELLSSDNKGRSYIDKEAYNRLNDTEKEEAMYLFQLLFAINQWVKENNKKASMALLPIKLGGIVDVDDYDTRYIFLKILSLPYDANTIDTELYNVLMQISKSIFVEVPTRVQFDEFVNDINLSRQAKYN